MSEIIVGRYQGRYLTAKNQQFVLLAAPTGADKGVGLVLPNLLNYPDSVVVFDLKLENFYYTSLFRQRHGHAVYLWAPFAEDGRSHRWNMLDAVARDALCRVGDILAIAQCFWPGDCHPKEKYWNDNARNLFLALVLYVMETPELPLTPGEVYRQSSGGGKPIRQHIEDILASRRSGSRPLSPECVDAFNRFLSASAEAVGNIISTFNAPLLIFANPIVDAATSQSDFDLRQVRRRRMSIYLGIPPHRLSDAGVLANIFFSQLIDLNTRELPERDASLRHECLLLLDELAAIGKIAILPKSNFYIRAYGLRLLSSLQSLAQLEPRYGAAEARTLIIDHTIQIIYPPADLREAEEYSKLLGYLTELRTSTSHTSTAGGASRTVGSAEHGRALMLPQELQQMPRHRQIIFARYCRPILCDKARYYDDHRFIARLKAISPTLARLDRQGWRRHLPGSARWAAVLPDKLQLQQAAFELRELSIALPAIPLSPPRRAAARVSPAARTPAKEPAAAATPIAIQLPPFRDGTQPTAAEAAAVVDAFFAQLPLFQAAAEHEAQQPRPDSEAPAVPSSHGCKTQPIDLSALDH